MLRQVLKTLKKDDLQLLKARQSLNTLLETALARPKQLLELFEVSMLAFCATPFPTPFTPQPFPIHLERCRTSQSLRKWWRRSISARSRRRSGHSTRWLVCQHIVRVRQHEGHVC